jgi:hypothetical protein
MAIHRARLRTRDYVTDTGTEFPVVYDHVPLGRVYLVHTTHPLNGKIMQQEFGSVVVEFSTVWVTTLDHSNDPGGLMCAQVLDIDEAPVKATP